MEHKCHWCYQRYNISITGSFQIAVLSGFASFLFFQNFIVECYFPYSVTLVYPISDLYTAYKTLMLSLKESSK